MTYSTPLACRLAGQSSYNHTIQSWTRVQLSNELVYELVTCEHSDMIFLDSELPSLKTLVSWRSEQGPTTPTFLPHTVSVVIHFMYCLIIHSFVVYYWSSYPISMYALRSGSQPKASHQCCLFYKHRLTRTCTSTPTSSASVSWRPRWGEVP